MLESNVETPVLLELTNPNHLTPKSAHIRDIVSKLKWKTYVHTVPGGNWTPIRRNSEYIGGIAYGTNESSKTAWIVVKMPNSCEQAQLSPEDLKEIVDYIKFGDA